MDGENIDYLEYARTIIGRDPLAAFLGITVEEVRENYALCSIVVKPHLMNILGRAHGSLIYALSDQALAVASNSAGNSAMTVNFNINYIAGASEGEKICSEARPVKVGKAISVWKIEVTGPGKNLIASGEAIAYHKNKG